MGALMRSFDWSKTALGPVKTWSSALRDTTSLLLANCFPMLLWWGPDFLQLYNDAYVPVLGDKHPHAALGKPFRECWSEVFHVLGPLAQTPFEGGPPTLMQDIPLEVNRFGFMEETHFTIGYSPVPDETAPNGIGGVLATVHEITEKVVSERRIFALRDLSTRSFEAKTAEEACSLAASIFANNEKDLPFTLLYLTEENGSRARLCAATGIKGFESFSAEVISLSDEADRLWPLATHREQVTVQNLKDRFGKVPPGPWSDPPDMASIVPIKSSIGYPNAGFLIAGISSRLRFDDSYRGYLELLSAQIGTAISNARAYEEERHRNEALAEIDRAKTMFFTNVSHEFRTPLTLMMAPIEDALADQGDPLSIERESLELAHRNSLRLLKLVNTLLDFSRIEAGRTQAVYEPVDLSALTAELASVFRSAVERAGMKLIVDCPPLDAPVYVDREMWEKVVLNLISNAFKFTLEGSIEVSLKPAGDKAELRIRDTGTGIAAEHLPHIFTRFYRVKNARGRSYEGSGIGLALVQELVKLNGGSVRVESQEGHGSTFIVSIPFGAAHLSPERIGAARTLTSTAVAANAFVQEALRWLPKNENTEDLATVTLHQQKATATARIVLAEDNNDMREYVRRLLAGAYEVEPVEDGQAALEAVLQNPPDLVLTDIMMPRLDGFGLLKALRENEETASVPVILLSARAGEEARMEGIAASADDYLVKPFSARELVARVENVLALSRLRRQAEMQIRESEERFRAFVAASSDVIYRMSPDWTEMRQLSGRDFIADSPEPNRTWLDKYIHPDDQSLVVNAIQEAIRTKSVFELEHRVLRVDGGLGWTFSRAIPLLDEKGEIVEWFGAATDVTERKEAQEALLRSEKLASMGRMAASIAHEINNPLEAVTNLLYLAQTVEGLPQLAQSHLQLADSELKRVAHIARQSLGFYREGNARGLTSLNRLVESTLDLLRGRVENKRAVITRELSADVEIMALAGELRQVISNLLVNSLDAIDTGGAIRIRVSMCADKQHVRLMIADNGRGIRQDARKHLFEPFFTTKGIVGTGLGLWVTKQIIDKHKGRIYVRSRTEGEPRGTAFAITLPIQ